MTTRTQDKRRQTAAKVAALTLSNAFIFQEQLAASDRRVRTLRQLLEESDFVTKISGHWKYICDNINYVPIFKIARDILLNIPSGTESDGAVRRLASTALSISQNRVALRHDLMGRIYHWLLHDAKYLGTYYTSVAAATLLLRLSFHGTEWARKDWSDFEELTNFRIGDLACGTGTLLIAASHALSDNVINSLSAQGEEVDETTLKNLHQTLIENIIHGYDVIPSAVHLTASSLGLMAPEIAFRKMQLYCLPLGKEKRGSYFLGSIEYAQSESISTQLDFLGEPDTGGAAEAVTGYGGAASTAPLPRLSLSVMNPPFVRSVGGNLLFGSLPAHRTQMQNRLRRIIRPSRKPNLPASSTAGLGSVFIAVADRHIEEGGRQAIVIPASICTGVAWGETRALFDHSYELEYVVSSHDPVRWSFSENTDLSEVLLIARKTREEKDNSHRTIFVNLWSNPGTIVSALALSDAIIRSQPVRLEDNATSVDAASPIRVGNMKYGEILSVSTQKLRDRPWVGGAFAQTVLNRVLFGLLEGYIHQGDGCSPREIPVTDLGSLGRLGPDRRDIYDGFNIERHHTAYAAFWGHNSDEVQKMAVSPNRWLSPLSQKKPGRNLRNASSLWKLSGRLFLAERMRLNTQAIVAVRMSEPGLSNVWWPFQLENWSDEKEKALALWLNSTLGLLLFFGNRVPTEGSWVQFKKPNLQRTPTLDVEALDSETIWMLSKGFDELSELRIGRLASIDNDEVRARIDRFVESALATGSVQYLRGYLAYEPVVRGQPLVVGSPTDRHASGDDLLSLL